MAILEVLKYPDPRLRHKAKPVDKVTPELKQLAEDMLETMYSQKGIGLAAIQVGVDVALLVIDIRPQGDEDRYDLDENLTDLEKAVEMPLVIFNPVITKKEGKTTFDEGCLSLPGYYETVQRSKYIEVTGLDKDGNPLELQLDGLLSICMQHEMDHLDGKVFIDRLSPIKSNRIKAKIKKFGYSPPEEEEEAEEKLLV
ncbi:MAG: peptide deformylase [Bdellovibrionales bacterium]|nr:peptide deformylase [Bdellovibrionales bacterium]